MSYRVKTRPEIHYGENIAGEDIQAGFYRCVGYPKRAVYASSQRIAYTFDGNRRTFNVCEHSYEANPYDLLPLGNSIHANSANIGWDTTQPSAYERNPYALVEPAWYVGVRPLSSMSVDLTKDISGCAYDAYLDVMAAAPAKQMNVLRSALELKDTKQTINSLVSLVRWGTSAKALHMFKLSGLSTCARVAEAYLTYQFGIAPTAKDVKQFIASLSQGTLRVRAHPRIIGKGAIIKASYGISPSDALLRHSQPDVVSHSSVSTSWIGTNGVFYVPKRENPPVCPYSGGLKAVHVKAAKGVIFARCLRTIVFDAAGTSLSRDFTWSCPLVKTLWDLTPFSFLVDWFIGVGKVIERMSKLEIIAQGDLALSAVWHSAKTSYTTYNPLISCSNSAEVSDHTYGSKIWTVKYSSRSCISGWSRCCTSYEYSRRPYIVPVDALIPSFRWSLSSYQLSTGCALLINLGAQLMRIKASKPNSPIWR